MSNSVKYDYLVVGSGAGGATIARELTKKGNKVLIVEKGNSRGLPKSLEKKLTIEGLDIYYAFGAGGTTVLSDANAVCWHGLEKIGIDLKSEFKELEEECHVAKLDMSLLKESGVLKVMRTFEKMDLDIDRMPKFIDSRKCKGCGLCFVGCRYGAKWTALEYLNEAVNEGANAVYNTSVEKVIVEDGKAVGVSCKQEDKVVEYRGDNVIVSAGGLNTPIILQKTGIEKAGKTLFIDLVALWFAVTPDIDISQEPNMALVDKEFLESKNFTLALFHENLEEDVRYWLGEKAEPFLKNNWIGFMAKIADDNVGAVNVDGTVSKVITENDRKKIQDADEIIRKIFKEAGAQDEFIVHVQKLSGGHPGGSAPIGIVVDKNLETEIKNLYVCDASVIPYAPGVPIIMTIMALAKRLAKTLG